jgi:hypothetical protein
VLTLDASNATTTLPANVVTTDGTQTLTNKSIATTQLTGTITPSNNTVSLDKLTATGTKDATTFLRGDNSFQEVPAGGITEADQWRITANANSGTNADLSSNWERNDGVGATYIGTGLTESSGIFSFPSTGKYLINFQMVLHVHGGDTNAEVYMLVTTDNSSYTIVSFGHAGNGSSSDGVRSTIANSHILDVTDTSNVKFKFKTDNFISTTLVGGSSSAQTSGFYAIRLGDT